jgi:hypothetical protein
MSNSDTDDSRTDRLEKIGRTIGNGLAWPFLTTGHVAKVAGRTFATSLTRRIPFVGKRFWRGQIKFATRQYQKAAGADVVNLSAEPHGIEPRAAKYVEADPDEPDKRPGWKEIGGDRTWGAGAEGRDVERMGRADVILTDRAATETASPLQMRVAEALDLEQVDALIEGGRVNVVEMWPKDPGELDAGAGPGGQAIADGGSMAQRSLEVDVADAGLKDAVVDLGSDFGNGQGMRISWRKYKEQYEAKTDPEEMMKQETRGFLAGMSGTDQGKLFKLAVIALLVILAIAVGPTLIQVLFGGGAGGGVGIPI